MSLPEEFLSNLLGLAKKFANPEVKVATLKEAQEVCGRAGRVGQIVPEAKPFVSSFYGALAGSLRALECRSREAPPGKVATRSLDERWNPVSPFAGNVLLKKFGRGKPKTLSRRRTCVK